MSPWKKIASLFIISASAGLFVPACAADVESEKQTDPSEIKAADVATEEDTATMEEIATDLPSRDDVDRDWGDRGRGSWCVRRCQDEFFECRRGYGRDYDFDRDGRGYGRRCRSRLDSCINMCRRFR